jgi:hypothetical protein
MRTYFDVFFLNSVILFVGGTFRLNVVASRGGDGRLGGSRWIGAIRVPSSGRFVVVSWVVTLNFVVAGHCPQLSLLVSQCANIH